MLNYHLYEDRGGLLYPSRTLISRLWTLYKFGVKVLPLLGKATHVLNDLTLFLIPMLENCDTFQCNHTASEKLNPDTTFKHLIHNLLIQFFTLLIRNQSNVTTNEQNVIKQIVPTSKNRRLKTLR